MFPSLSSLGDGGAASHIGTILDACKEAGVEGVEKEATGTDLRVGAGRHILHHAEVYDLYIYILI
jgi:hypothetical protein